MASISKRGKAYRITVSNGRRSDGSQILEKTTWHPDPSKTDKQNEKALQLLALEFEERVKAGKLLEGDKLTVQQFSEKWLSEYVKATKEAATISQYEYLLTSHILPEIGAQKLTAIKPIHILELLNKLSRERKDGKPGGYSKKTLKHVKEVCSSMFTTAINWGIITLNPCDHVTLPNPVAAVSTVPDLRGENYFTAEQTIIFLEYLNKDFQSTHSAHDRTMTNGKEYHVAEYTETHSIPSQLRIFYNLAVYGGLRRMLKHS